MMNGRSSLLIVAILSSISVPACADWKLVYEDDKRSFYIDPPTIRSDGSLRRVWAINDLATAATDGGVSSRMLLEHDCNGRVRILEARAYAGHMGEGRVVHTQSSPSTFVPFKQGSAGEATMVAICQVSVKAKVPAQGSVERTGDPYCAPPLTKEQAYLPILERKAKLGEASGLGAECKNSAQVLWNGPHALALDLYKGATEMERLGTPPDRTLAQYRSACESASEAIRTLKKWCPALK